MKEAYFNIGDKLRCIKKVSCMNVQDECKITRIKKYSRYGKIEYIYEVSNEVYCYDFLYKSLAVHFDVKTLERQKKLANINNLI